MTTPGVDAAAVLQTQRSATMRSLQDLTRLKRHGTDSGPQDVDRDLSWRLVLESMVFAAEAEIRWLDHCETVLLRAGARATGRSGRATSGTPTGAPDQADQAVTEPGKHVASDRRVRS